LNFFGVSRFCSTSKQKESLTLFEKMIFKNSIIKTNININLKKKNIKLYEINNNVYKSVKNPSFEKD